MHSNSDNVHSKDVKFKDYSLNQVWSSKTKSKGIEVTMLEFLTKRRHKTFLAARQRVGVTKCWTRDGVTIVVIADGTKNRVTSQAKLNIIPSLLKSKYETLT